MSPLYGLSSRLSLVLSFKSPLYPFLVTLLLDRVFWTRRRRKHKLNVINVNFFTPCLLFSKVAFSLSSDKLRELWIIPIFFVLVSVVSLGVAWILGPLFKLDRQQRNFAMAAAMIMNSNSLPVALLQSLAVTVPGLNWGQEDTVDAIVGRSLTYLLLCGTMGQLLRWSYGVRLLSKAVSPDETTCASSFGVSEELENDRTSFGVHPSGFGDSDRAPPLIVADSHQSSQYTYSTLRTHGLENFDWVDDCASLGIHRILVVALNEPLQHLLSVYLRPICGAISQAGDCSIPLTLVVLGAYFHQKSPSDIPEPSNSDDVYESQSLRVLFASRLHKMIFCLRKSQKDDTGTRPCSTPPLQNKGEGTTVFVVILARMFLAPALLLPFVVFGTVRGYPHVFKDPVFILSHVLLLASPPALTLAQITQATSDSFERLISRTIFWSYCLVAPPAMVAYALIALLIIQF
ncbi:membrane transport protein-domain-containing protein [Multifurca ochricompacta]|uniref:Membrane transport protein-domain-containing protein n=1 Tax=Multifurca ochricompacta TaxID=376703 RepID=A0AAD4QL17_9AGAM|nr:membrane transport protein-domain-containing protein [Multifurca ochricompacta]